MLDCKRRCSSQDTVILGHVRIGLVPTAQICGLPSSSLQQVRLIEYRHGQPLHRSRQILADFK
jgi:hypothetical protein